LYIREQCDKKGLPRNIPFPPSAALGIRQIQENTKKTGNIFLVTDKSGKLFINTPENYDAASQKHKVFSEGNLSSQERTLNHYTYQVARFPGVGSTQSDVQEKKMRSALKNTMILPPILYCAPKDHKILKPDEEHLGPPSRPMYGAREAPNAQLSMLLTHVFNAAVDDKKNTIDTESSSTEDMIAAFEHLNNTNNTKERGPGPWAPDPDPETSPTSGSQSNQHSLTN
jgi:hypothetical protein